MWLDNASSIDMLFYSPYADTIVNFTKNSYLTPLTIGLYGSWGAGKSSLLQLIEQRIEDDKDGIVCISLNAWQFEGYENAKVAIMESLLKSLKENETFLEKAHEKITKLLSRVDYLKVGKSIIQKGLPYAIGMLTGNPLPIAFNLSADTLDAGDLLTKLQSFKTEYIKEGEKEDTITENIRKFREEFEDMLEDVSSVRNLIVIIDDLDRCSPERIIDTLEAIKLFLSVKKTTFIVAVDQRIIEYAVNIKYPQIDGFAISSDYIEKIIQLPIKIPELSPKDIENYLLLLVSQLHISEEGFETLINEIYDNRMMLRDKALMYSEIATIIENEQCSYKEGTSKSSFDADASIISKIGPTVSSSLKGNPRQAKRFLNTFFVRKNLASLYFGEDIDLSVMAKLLALETIEIRAFRKLYEWSSNFNGEIKQLKEIEYRIKDGKELDEEYALWAPPRITKWLKSEPIELYKQDLSKYFYLSREALSSVESISSTFSESERKMLSAFQNCMKGQENLRIEELKKMEPVSQRNICDALIEHFKADSIALNIIAPLYCNYADFRTDISEAILQKPSTFFTMAVIPHMVIMHKASPTQFEELLNRLKSKKFIKDEICSMIKAGDFGVTTVERKV